uniref:Uncharacterized protein n=1 Tax=Arundo donax TaxID=35708 RepID=A0A0A9GI91_ARUDO
MTPHIRTYSTLTLKWMHLTALELFTLGLL